MTLDLNGRTLVNALTLLWLACLVPVDPLGRNLLFTVTVYSFMTVGIVNHLFPRDLRLLTHVVKALYSLLLVLTIRINPLWALPVMLADLLPLASARLRFSETMGAACRIACIAIGFFRMHFNPWLMFFYLLGSGIYFVERRHRIRMSQRHEYGWFHHFEHLAFIAFLCVANYDLFEPQAIRFRLIAAPIIVFSLLTLLGVIANLSRLNATLPDWFDRSIEVHFRRKLAANVRSLKLYNYFLKPFDHALTLKRVTWREIEHIVDSTPVSEPVDEVVGVLSGGAFIAPYVARRNGISSVSYIRSSYWSANTLIGTITKIAAHLLERPVTSNLEFPADFNVADKVVLLVDDTICTSATIDSISAELYRRRAKRVIRYALFSSAPAKADYAGVISAAPLIWPWGWEAD